jgi:hypothetical protein
MRLRSLVLVGMLLFGTREASAHGDVTFNNQVVRIFQQHCQMCHRPGNIAPFSLLTYSEARMRAFQIRGAVESGEMPPWKPANAHGTFEGERALSDAEIETISDWVAAGAPEGDPRDLPETLTFPDTWAAGPPDRIVQPATAFPLDASSEDVYRCFPLALNSQTDVYVRGYEILPGNRKVVHHVLLFIDERGQSVALDNADPGPGYTCFGGAGFTSGLGALGGWAPGAGGQTFPLGTGIRIRAGARLVMQVHYSTSEMAAESGALDADLTRLGLYVSPAPLEGLSFVPVINPFFEIPAGASHYEVKAFLPILNTVELVAIAPHMHLLGREVTVTARLPNRSVRQLIRIEDWDFHWQGNYTFREPIVLPAGTIIEMSAFYDNSSDNPKNPTNPPVAVNWGERTTDEMCITFLTLKTPGTPSINTVSFSLGESGAESVMTQGGGATQLGYGRVTEAENAAPAGLAILGYRQNDVLVSETSVPASRPLTQGRMYAETNGAVRSGLAIANPNAEAAVVTFTFTDENGRDVTASSVTIDANRQIAAFLNESPFNGPSPFSGALTFNSTKPVAVVALRGIHNERSDFLVTTLPVVDLNASSPVATVLPHFADGGGWSSTVMLVNPTNNSMVGTLQFVDSTGGAPSTVSYSIPARSARRFATNGAAEVVRDGAVVVAPAADNAAPSSSLVISYRKASVRVSEAGVPAVPAGTGFRVYVEASSSIQSGVAILNTTASSATVRIELIDVSGMPISSTAISLAAHTHLAKFLHELPGFQTLRLPNEGLLRISSTAPVAVVGLRTRVNERGDLLMAATPPVSESSAAVSELFFPHFADGGGYTTQFVVFNTGAAGSAKGAIRFFSQSGQSMSVKLK